MDSKKHKDRQTVPTVAYLMHTCIVHNISNEQFTVLLVSPNTIHKTLNLFNTAFFILLLALLPSVQLQRRFEKFLVNAADDESLKFIST